MERLPDEVLLMIFERLSPREIIASVSLVCRRWNALASRRALVVRRDADARRVRGGLAALVVARGGPLLALLARAARAAPGLRHLTVHAAAPLGREHLAALAALPHLRHLDVFSRPRVFDRRLLPTAARLASLVVNESVAPGLLAELASAGERLRALHMFGRALHYPRGELLALLRARGRRLRELTLRCPELTTAAYEAVGRCSGLTSLQLYSCWLMSGAAALHAARPPRLRRLHLTGTFMVRRAALADLVERLQPSLEELALSSSCFGDEHVAALAARVPALRVLELWRCRLSARGALALAAALPELRFLDLDVELTHHQIRVLESHPALERLRCLPRRSSENDEGCMSGGDTDLNTKEMVTSDVTCAKRPFRLEAADTRYASKYFRGSGEGFRANLFYYSTQDEDLKPLSRNAQPTFYHDDTYC